MQNMSDSKFYAERFDWWKKWPNLRTNIEFDIKKALRDEAVQVYAKDKDVFNSIARYVIFLNDERSPLAAERETTKAKRKAMTKAGVPDSYRDDLMEGENILANRMVIRFLRYQNNHKMSELMAKRELFYMTVKELSTPLDEELGDDKQTSAYQRRLKMAQDVGPLRKDIEQLETELFGQDTGLAKDILEEEDNQIQSGATEDYAVSGINEL